jgi:hypothetical protein
VGCIEITEEMDKWQVVVCGSTKCGKFLDWLRNKLVFKKDSTSWS